MCTMTEAGHVVIAPDKFKGSLTAAEVASHVAIGLRRFRPDLDVRLSPVADGGDGTLDAVIASGYERRPVVVTGPTGVRVDSAFAVREGTTVIELADASGLNRLPGGRFEPMTASSRGTGELIAAAMDAGCTTVVIGVGGSASTDGGAGLLEALGARLLDDRGRPLRHGGGALADLASLDLSGLDPRLSRTAVLLASDVDNPLLGPHGAAAVYGPQKGAAAEQVAELDQALHRFADVLAATTGRDLRDQPGAGAAGGVGFAALAVLNAEARAGIDVILDLIGFEQLLDGAHLVITGEGSLDEQSLRGKAPIGVARAAARHGLPTIAIAGRCSLSTVALQAAGLRAAYWLSSLEPDPDVSIGNAGRLIEDLAASVVGPEWLSDVGCPHGVFTRGSS